MNKEIDWQGIAKCWETLVNENERALDALRDLARSHIELVKGKDRCYFRIKGSKGKEKSWTSYAFLDFWEEWFTPVEEDEGKKK